MPSDRSNEACRGSSTGIPLNHNWAEMLRFLTWPTLLLYIFFLPFDHLGGHWLSFFRNVLLTVIAVDLLQRIWLRRWLPSPLDYPLWAYGAAMAVASALSLDSQYSLKAFHRTLLPFLILYHSTWQHLNNGRSIRHVAWSLVLAAMLVALLGFVFLNTAGGRLGGVFPVATQYGKYLDLAIPVTFGLLFFENAWRTKVLLGTLAASEIVAMLWNGTRGSFVALSIIWLVSAIFSRRHWPAFALCAVIAAGFLFTLPESSPIPQRIVDVISSPGKLAAEDPALQDRKGYYQTAWAMIKERPIVGWGYSDHIARHVTRSKDEAWFKKNDVRPLPSHAHNLFLEILLEGGVVGLAAALWIAVTLVHVGITILKDIRSLHQPLALGFLAGLSALGIHSLVDVPRWSCSLLAAVYIAIVATRGRENLGTLR